MQQQNPVFEIVTRDEPGIHVVCLRGELDLAQCPAVESALIDAELKQAARVLIDLDELTFVDLSGLRTLTGAAVRAASNGDRLRITRARGQVARMLRMTRLDTTLPILADAALGEVPDDRLLPTH